MSLPRRSATPPFQSTKKQILSQKDQQIIASLQDKLAEQQADIQSRSSSIQDLRKNMELLSSKFRGEKDQMKDLQQRLDEAKRRIEYLENQLYAAQQDASLSVSLKEKLEGKEVELQQLSEKIQYLTQAISEKNMEIKRLTTREEDQTQEIRMLKSMIDKMEKEKKEDKLEFEQSINKLQLAMAQLTSTQKRLQSDLETSDQMKNEFEAKWKCELEKVSRLEGILREKEREWNEKLLIEKERREKELEMSAKEKEDEMRRLNSVIEKERLEKERMKVLGLEKEEEKQRETGEVVAKMKEWKKKMDAMEQKLKDMEKKLMDEQATSKLLTQQIAEERDESSKRIHELEDVINSLRKSQMAQFEKQKEALEAEKKAYEEEIRQKQREEREKERAFKERENKLKEEVSRMEALIMPLKQRLSSSSVIAEQQQKTIQELREEIARLKAKEPDADEKMKRVRECERQMKMAVEKIGKAVVAVESDLTCLCCMNVFDNPMTLIPCGHVMCEKCCKKSRNEKGEIICIECQSSQPLQTDRSSPSSSSTSSIIATAIIPNKLLDNTIGKVTFQKQALTDLRHVVSTLISTATE
ncbi:uncharacterized protein MONOS_8939 [Monocercomonoides exilis]|uniref:uncharacterized protein n=1 Tax=Monocercomonoides exilis TaxID=2049356 RepID=UPI00355A83CE|nr:hypothetical protein MONOS_8939 [Monocercomonoides exilis]|eukprot:MONOS_8939.1-p1 / transcript=MONOS_8939.1 / gene=MONOS_8939 / organism=Monocercomonoides_exilis_PA203 / gene_product=unspecified product / transcript_product=unspecified product / location=Mono_scaffold00352:22414-24745(+) / protein_length=585 / sequence_SO=supercontig / SO=protein_coding / is_pseudo=false